jgi:hypothetical protein
MLTPRTGTYAGIFSTTPAAYPHGDRVISTNGGSTWFVSLSGTPGTARDLSFRIYMQTGFASAGNFVSSVKDANPAAGRTATWSRISWNAAMPAGTTLQFQAAASNSANGPFNFVGPDGTASTFFDNGASLAQFNGSRYLRYQALLTTSNTGTTPAISDVTVCYVDTLPAPTTLAMSPASGTYGGATNMSATLTSSDSGVSGKSISFTLNGSGVGSVPTDAAGVATLSNVSLTGIDAGTYPGAVGATFSGDTGYAAATGSSDLTIAKADQTISFGPLDDKTFGDADFIVSAIGGASGNPVTFSTTSTACRVSGATVTILAAGRCTIRANQADTINYNAAPEVSQPFNIAFATQGITFPPIASFRWLGGSATLTATASSGLDVSYAVVSGPCAVAGRTLTATSSGICVVAANQAGNGEYSAAAQVTQTAAIAKAAQTITFGALTGKTFGDADFTINATASAGLAVSFVPSGNCFIAGATVHLTGAGSCTITASQSGDSNYDAAPSVPQTFAIGAANQIIFFGALANKTFGDPDFDVAASASSGLPVSFSATGNCTIAGTTVHLTSAGSCTITASQSGNANYNTAHNVSRTFQIAKKRGRGAQGALN